MRINLVRCPRCGALVYRIGRKGLLKHFLPNGQPCPKGKVEG